MKLSHEADSVAFLSGDTQILSCSSYSVKVWDVSTGVVLKVLKSSHVFPNMSAVSSNCEWAVFVSEEGYLQLCDISTGVMLKWLKGHTEYVCSVALSIDGTRIVSGSKDNCLRVWDVSTGGKPMELKGHTSKIRSLAFSSDGTQIVSGSSDNSVRVWDASMIGCENFIWNLADNNWIISSNGQDHLMWVPQGANLVQGYNTLIISRSGFSTVDFHQSMIGVDWVHCYTP